MVFVRKWSWLSQGSPRANIDEVGSVCMLKWPQAPAGPHLVSVDDGVSAFNAVPINDNAYPSLSLSNVFDAANIYVYGDGDAADC